MYNHNVCPFCGGKPIKKNYISDRIKNVGVGAGAMNYSLSGQINIDPNPEKEEYFKCNGCNQTYVWADIDINLILGHIKGGKNIPKLIKYYYSSGVLLTDLLTHHITGIVRKRTNILSWLPVSIVKRQLYICFNYNGIRTFGVFVRKKKTKYYYTIKTIGVVEI